MLVPRPEPRLMEIFSEALELNSADDRAAYLDRVCGSDRSLRVRVEGLLGAHVEGDDFLEIPASVPTVDVTPAGRHAPESAGARIGPYKLLETIGEGGMGTVFMAEQTEPVRRRVALKVIKPGMDTRQVIARFEAERQALAMMDHPNIAKVHDAGMTATGRPYFVMELVRGLPITEYCDRHQLSIPERLELFTLVCRAVQHAHQKGVIHRDLKPSNVLVTDIDGVPTPKVIDFGVAKATGASLTERTLYTAFHNFVGTPLYMSPEQADLSSADVDTRSDIYSLGVLLYELLTGTTPFDSETLKRAAVDELRRIIREQEPPRPSTRLSSLGATLTTVSANRKIDARRLDRTVRGELDWIVMKALEKDRRRRYETANDFAADLMRYLTDQAVEACPPSAWYRFGKFAHRNRVALATGGLLTAALIVGTSVSLWQARKAKRAEAEARQRADESRQVIEYLAKDIFGASTPGKRRGRSVTVGELLDRADATLGERFRGRPLVEASVRLALAGAYGEVYESKRAVPHVDRAVQIRQQYLGPEHPETLEALLAQAWILDDSEPDKSRAIATARHVLAVRRRLLGPAHPDTLRTQADVAAILSASGLHEEAEGLAAEVEALGARLLGPEHEITINARFVLGTIAQSRGKLDRAEALLRQFLAAHEQTVQHFDGDQCLFALRTLANTVRLQGRAQEARLLHLEVVNRHVRVFGLSSIRTSGVIGELFSALKELGDHGAIRDLCEGWIRELLPLPPEPDRYDRSRRAIRLESLALRLTTTLPAWVAFDAELAVRAVEQATAVDGGWYSWMVRSAISCRLGRLDEALEALQASQRQPDWTSGNDLHWFVLAAIHVRRGDLARARECYERGRAPDTKRDNWTDIVDHFRSESEAQLGVNGKG